ncbi:MAG: sensor histidine kinase [Geminicoccales bacterium]
MSDRVVPTQSVEFDINHQQRLLSAFAGLTEEMSRASSKEEVLSLAATWVPNIVPADRASITFPVDADNLAVHALEGDKAIPIGLLLPIADTTTGTAFRELRTVLIEDTSKHCEMDVKMLAGKGLVTCINAPMISQGRSIGTLNVAHWKSGVYTPGYAALLSHVAGVLAAQLNLLDRFFSTQGKLEVLVAKRTQELEIQKARLQMALDKEKELSGLQRQFVSMVSHEFRTPLAIIDGAAQRFLRRPEKATVDKLTASFKKIRNSVSRLMSLIETVLDAAHLEEGRIKFEPGDCVIRDVLEDLQQAYLETYPKHRIEATLEELPSQITADECLIRQVFSNLLSNAVKYSPEGTTVHVGGWQDGEIVVVSIQDDGVGIPEEELVQLFERFFRASTSTGIAGTGIGLYLTHHFIDLHGGSIEVDSSEGTGTTFTVRLPIGGKEREAADHKL